MLHDALAHAEINFDAYSKNLLWAQPSRRVNRLKRDSPAVLVRKTDLSDEPRNLFRGGLATQRQI
jgi:hypothetical protein